MITRQEQGIATLTNIGKVVDKVTIIIGLGSKIRSQIIHKRAQKIIRISLKLRIPLSEYLLLSDRSLVDLGHLSGDSTGTSRVIGDDTRPAVTLQS
jgi:hypothetical protein